MTQGLVDCHAHLDQFGINDPHELEIYLQRAGTESVLSVGMDVDSSRAALRVASRSPRVLGAVGLHPWNVDVDWANEERLAVYEQLAADPVCRAISEVGLDTNAVDVPVELQQEALAWFIGLAQRHSLPMVLHLQAPVADLLEVWSSVDGPPPRAAIHGFFGSADDARQLLDTGFWLSLGTVTTGVMAGGPPVDAHVIRMVPDDRLLLDSDAYVPEELLRSVTSLKAHLRTWLEGAHPLETASLRVVAEHIASVRGTSVDELAEIVATSFSSFLLGHPSAQ